MTVPHESFTYGLENGAIRFNPSSQKVKLLLKPQSLEYLTNLTLPRNLDEDTIETRFPTEDVVAVTKLSRTLDQHRRPITNNKTVIIALDDYLRAYPPKNLVKDLLR